MRISDWSSDVCSSDLLGASGEIAVLHRRELLRNGGDLGHHGRFGVAAVGLDAAFDAADQAPRVQHLQVGFQQVAEFLGGQTVDRSDEQTSELQSTLRTSYAVVSLNKKHTRPTTTPPPQQ